jgi:hypothetical protein
MSRTERSPHRRGLTPLTPGVPPAEARALLETGRLHVVGLMPFASNSTFLVEALDGKRSVRAIYKPRDGEAPLWDFPIGTLCRREVAAFVLAEALGWPAVPLTVLREGPHGPGAVQLFVPVAGDEHYFTLRDRRMEDFLPVAIFDAVANNADRKAGHCLLGPDDVIWCIDHGVCFAVEPKLRTVIWDFAGRAVPGALADDVRRVATELRAGPLRRAMVELLSADEVDATADRADLLVHLGRLPHPTGPRPYPWPPV